MKLLLYLSTKRENSQKLAPIYCRITINKSRVEFSTGIYIPLNKWSKKKTITGNSSEVAALNLQLDDLKARVNLKYIELQSKYIIVTAEMVRSALINAHQALTFYEAAEKYYHSRLTPGMAQGTKQTYIDRLSLLKRYLNYIGRPNLSVDSFDLKAVTDYDEYLSLKGYTDGYRAKNIQYVRSVSNWAYNKGYSAKSYIATYTVKKGANSIKSTIQALTGSELEMIENYTPRQPKLQQTRVLFLLQCYTGVSYADISALIESPSQYHGDVEYRIVERQKSKQLSIIPLSDKAKELIAQITHILCIQKYNSYLKELAEVIGIERNLTTHIGRKTFATISINKGYSIETVSKIVGHANTRTTLKLYADIRIDRIAKEFIEKEKNNAA